MSHEESLELETTSGADWGVWGGIAALLVLLIGAVGYISGLGWFGYRPILYGRGQLYVMNRGTRPASISVDGRPDVTIQPDHYEIVELVGGTNSVVVTRGEERQNYTIETNHSDAFLRLTTEQCLVATDITPFYGGGETPDELEIVEEIKGDQHVYIPGSYNVMWPQQRFPDQLPGTGGPGIWVESIGCALFDEPRYLQSYLMVRLRDRLGIIERGSNPNQ